MTTPENFEKADVRLAYLVANKTPVTPEELKAIICRIFVGSFVDEGGYETSMLEHFVAMLYALNVAIANEEEENTDVKFVEGSDAESLYISVSKTAYIENGFDVAYANEAAAWPELLPMVVRWDPDLLSMLARLEVGHDLVVMDVVRNMRTAGASTDNG